MRLIICALLLSPACARSDPVPIALPSAPPLPLTGTVVRVSTSDDLQRAAHDARSDLTIVLEPGRYVLSEPLRIGGADDEPVTHISVRGTTPAHGEVIIEESGMEIGNARGVLIADLTFRNLSRPAVHARGESGAADVHVYHVRFENVHAQAVKATAPTEAPEKGVSNGVVEYSDFEYTHIDNDSDGWNAVALYGTRGWIIKYNRFLNVRSGLGVRGRLRPAIVSRHRASDTHTHNNLFIDCDRPIAYGIEAQPDDTPDHVGGSIYNNFIYRRRGLRGDAGIMLWASRDTKVYHNTIIQNGTYQRAIEYRYKATTGLDIRNNLTDGDIAGRDEAHATVAANYVKATLSMFRDPRAGDLRLLPSSEQAIDRGVPLPGWAFDWDGEQRPFGARPDLGADESYSARGAANR